MKSLCQRAWEVEALEDGRLRDKDRASFERHAETCADCNESLQRLRELGKLLAEVPTAGATDLEHRRARATLLARANDAIVGRSGSPRSRAVAVSAVVAFAAIVLVFVAFRSRTGTEVASIGAAATPVASPPPPAGVDSAAASLGSPPASVALGAAPPSDVDAGANVVQPRLPKTEAASASAPNLAPAAVATASPSASSARATSVAGERFARAMATFNAGDYGEADRAFVAFVRDFPADSRAEDAMFLVADARARRGDAAGARDAARSYLRRFPNGLRAPAAERLAADPR